MKTNQQPSRQPHEPSVTIGPPHMSLADQCVELTWEDHKTGKVGKTKLYCNNDREMKVTYDWLAALLYGVSQRAK